MKKLLLLAAVLLITSPDCAPAYAQAVDLGTSASTTNPQRTGAATTGLFSSTSDAVSISSAGTEIMRVNGTGVGIGTTSPSYPLSVYTTSANAAVQGIADGDSNNATIDMDSYNSASTAGAGFTGRFAHGSMASPTAVSSANTDRIGYVVWSGYTGSSWVNAIGIEGHVDAGTVSSTSLPSYLSFQTEANGSVTRTEAMRINESGDVGIGTSAPTALLHVAGIARANQFIIGESTDTYNGSIEITYSDSSNYGIYFQDTNSGTTNAPALEFERTGSSVGNIALTFTSTAYNTTSDRRLKENITDTTSGLEQLMQIPVHDFNFIRDPKKIREQGLIAQELYKIYPEAVTPGGDDPKKKPWAIDYGRLTPLLLKAIQEQQKEIDTLKQELRKP